MDHSAVLARRERLAWVAPEGDGARLLGIDVARAIALLGMAVTHVFAATGASGRVTAGEEIFAGRSSALFAVLAGVSTALLTGRRVPLPGSERARASVALAVRAVLLAALGVGLVALHANVAVILTYYGLLFLVGLPFLGLRAPALLGLAAVCGVALPLVSYAVRDRLGWEPTYGQPSWSRLDMPGQLLEELTFTGYYPVVPWLTYLLAGLAVGRLDLGSRRVALRLLTAGASLAVLAQVSSALLVAKGPAHHALRAHVDDPQGIGLRAVLRLGSYGTSATDTWWRLASDGPHTGTPFDLAATTGSALAVIGLCLLLLQAGPVLRAALLPLAAAGGMTLTLYSLHIWALSRWDGEGAGTFYVAQAAVGLGAALLWRTLLGRGPLEAVLARITRLIRVARFDPPRAERRTVG